MKKNKVRSFYVGNLYKGLKKKFTIKEEPDQGYLEALRYQASVEQYRLISIDRRGEFAPF